jgi:hypothetical protein
MPIEKIALSALAAGLCFGCATKEPTSPPAGIAAGAEVAAAPAEPATKRVEPSEVPAGKAPGEEKTHQAATAAPGAAISKPGSTARLKPGEEWKPVTALTPGVAAKKIEQRLNSLSGVKVQVHFELRTPAGSGFGDPVLKIKDPKTFSFAYPSVQKGVLLGALARADGKLAVQKIGPTVTKKDLAKPPLKRDALEVERAWLENPGREVLAGFLDRRTPFSDLVASLPKRGYVLSIRKRTLQDLPNHIQYLMRAERPANSKAGKGLIEIIVDGRLFVPMSFLVQSRKPGSASDTAFVWSAGWLNKQSFDATEFETKVLSR